MRKGIFITGIISPIIYVLYVIIGGVLWKGYSQVKQPISDLSASGAPNLGMLNNFGMLSQIFGLIFAIGAFIYLKKLKIKSLNISMLLLIAEGVVSISYSFFPEDMKGATLTFTGIMHFVVTGLIVPIVILMPLFAGIAFKKFNEYKRFSTYSIITSIVIFISGILSVVVMANDFPFFGVVERINIGALQLWILLFAIKLLNMKSEN
ncbi:DUF998 domain-containing protein [Clostridium felsineum]|uniref:DUF998 domain-containing protein n=1 Tax=Clostridium felsineum TaxID=36839 RepID=UPI00214DB5B6|nr:DUF998 domain-containing protein [Clostridium felsineum]MCR3757515.1 DUF998 domain-containing protein [Clostridium felsineum]